MKLYVEKSTWSGWDSEEIPASANYEFDVDYGTEYVVDEIEADANHEAKKFTFTVVEVRENHIEIKTNVKMIDTSKVGVNGAVALIKEYINIMKNKE